VLLPLTEDGIATNWADVTAFLASSLADPHDRSKMNREQQGAAVWLIDFDNKYLVITNPGPDGPDSDGR
jgi:hypothetical protein